MDGNISSDTLRTLAAKAVGEWGMEASSLESFECNEHTLYKVTSAGQRRCVLRINDRNHQTDDELRSELHCLDALRVCDVPAPTVIPARDGALFKVVATPDFPEGRQCVLQGWVDGMPVSRMPGVRVRSDRKRVVNYRMVGELLARLHNCLSSWSPPENFTRSAWDSCALVGDNPRWGRFWELEALTAGQSDLLIAAAEIVRHKLNTFGRGPDRYGLIHANLVSENIIATESGMLPVCFGDCGYGWYLFDIVIPAFHLHGNENFDEAAGTLIESYRSRRDLADEHLDMLPTFLVARGLAELGWIHTRGETRSSDQTASDLINNVCSLAEDYCS